MEVKSDARVIGDAITRYHALLDGPRGVESARRLESELRRTNLVFGDRPICRVLRPFFLTRCEADRLNSDVNALASAFRKLLRVLETDPRYRGLLRLTAAEEETLAADRQGIEPDQIARIDGFLVRDGAFKVIEYNAESPGGIAFGEMLVKFFRELPVMEAFTKEYRTSTVSGLALTLRQLLEVHRQRLGARAHPNPTIAVVDWKSAPTRREFEICAEFFTSQGCPSRVIEPNELRYENGRLTAGDFAIDVVYKRVLVGDLVKSGGASHPLVRALKDGAIACASGFRVHLLFRKELFAFFWDDRLWPSFDERERAAIRRCVPWSRIVEDVSVDAGGGRTASLLDVIRRRREQLVLKPTDAYGGAGVVLGWHVSQSEWETAIAAAQRAPHLVQDRVEIPHETFPVDHGGKVEYESFFADISPYIWGGRESIGFGGRLASGELLNVTAGGGSAVPVFILE